MQCWMNDLQGDLSAMHPLHTSFCGERGRNDKDTTAFDQLRCWMHSHRNNFQQASCDFVLVAVAYQSAGGSRLRVSSRCSAAHHGRHGHGLQVQPLLSAASVAAAHQRARCAATPWPTVCCCRRQPCGSAFCGSLAMRLGAGQQVACQSGTAATSCA